jgi:hypothetical protein
VHQYMFIAVLAWFAYGSTVAHAQGLYKWVDSRGGIHYTNTPTNNTARTVDDSLPPAANFKSPTPPPEPTKPTTDTASENAPTPAKASNEGTPEQARNAAAPAEQPQASDQQ